MGMRPRKSEMPPSRHIVTSFAVRVSDAMAMSFFPKAEVHTKWYLSSLQKIFPPSLVGAPNVVLPRGERLWPRIGTLFGFYSRIAREEKRTGMGRATLLARTARRTLPCWC